MPADVNLGNRYFLTIQHNDLAWTIPAQLTINEASAIERRLRRVDLSLKPVMAGKGKNRHVKRIRPIEEDLVLEIAEAVIERRWSIDTPEVEGGLAA